MMNEWWVGGWMKGGKEGRTDGQMDGGRDGWMDRRQTDDRRTMDGWMNEWKVTEVHVHKSSYSTQNQMISLSIASSDC